MSRTGRSVDRQRRTLVVCLALASFAWGAGSALGQDEEPALDRRYGDLISVFSGDIHVPAGEDRRGMALSIGGNVEIEGTVTDVIVILGSLKIEGGVVRGQVVGVLSDLELRNARVEDQFVNVLGGLRESGSRIEGHSFSLPVGTWIPGLGGLIFSIQLFFTFTAFVVLLLLAALVPERLQLIGDEAPVRYVSAFFVGILGWLGALILVPLLLATLIGIPVALFGFYLLKWMGIGGVFYAIGRRLGRGLGREMSVVGAILATFTVYVLVSLGPRLLGGPGLVLTVMLSTMFFLLIEVPAMGLVLLTRFGTSRSVPAVRASAAYPPPAPPHRTPPVPPSTRPPDPTEPPADSETSS